MCKEECRLGSRLDVYCQTVGEAVGEKNQTEMQLVDCLWEWQHTDGWLPFDALICDKLESSFQSGDSHCSVSTENACYDVNFTHMWQQNSSTRVTRHIRRSPCKESPLWYWWLSDCRHRLAPIATMLLEQEYQKMISGAEEQTREVIWRAGGQETFIANVATMQLTEKTRKESYRVRCPHRESAVHTRATTVTTHGVDTFAALIQISRSIIKAPRVKDVGAETRYGDEPNEEESFQCMQLPTARRAGVSTEVGRDTGDHKLDRETSVHISTRGASIHIDLSKERAAKVCVSVSLAQSDESPEPHSVLEVSKICRCRCAVTEEPACYSGCNCHRRKCVHPGRKACFCHACICSSCSRSCQNCHSGNRLCSGNLNVGATLDTPCFPPQQPEDSLVTNAASLKRNKSDTTCSWDEDLAKQQNSSDCSTRAAAVLPRQRDEQRQPEESECSVCSQQQQLLREALGLQEDQLLLREERHLKKQIMLEEQQEKMHRQQQEVVNELQRQRDELSQKQAEIIQQQQQLQEKLARHQLILLQQAEEQKQVRSRISSIEDDVERWCGEKDEACSGADKKMDRRELLSSDKRPPASSVELEASTAALDTYLSPVHEERTWEDGYTCL